MKGPQDFHFLFGSSLAAVLIVATGSSGAAATPLCTADFVSRKCEDLTGRPLDLRRSRKEADGVIFNYFRALNPKFSSEVRNFGRKSTQTLRNRALDLAEDVRKTAIQVIAKNRPSSQLSAENRALIERLTTVRIQIFESDSRQCYSVGDPGVPNASYNPMNHTLEICSASLQTSSQWLAATLAHEFGHAISPCTMSSALIKFKEASSSVTSCLQNLDIETGHSVVLESEPRTYAVNHEPDQMIEFLRCGAAEVIEGSQVVKPLAYQEFSRCIEDQNFQNYENWISNENLALEVMPKLLPPNWQSLVTRAKEKTPLRCFRKSEEQFADSFGGLVSSAWAESKKMRGEQYKLSIHDLESIRCRERLTGEISMNRTDYPTPDERIETSLHNAKSAKLLNCKLPTSTLCHLGDTSFETTPKSDSSQNSAPRVEK